MEKTVLEYVEAEYLSHDAPGYQRCVATGGIMATTDDDADWIIEAEIEPKWGRLFAAAPELLAACQEFVRKVDAGEAKSTRSYAQMKAAIEKATAH